VIWSEPKDPYYLLARDIASAEGLPLAHTTDAALAQDPEFLIWVVAPDRLSEQAFSRLGAALQRHGQVVSVGLISGRTIDTARALWRRRPDNAGQHLSIVPREGQIDALEGGRIAHHPLTIEHVIAQIEQADYVMFQGHGTRRYWRLDETTELIASDLPSLPPQVVAAGACQTFKIWSEDSIALGFTDRGAAAYVGFLHSPTGYLFGDPKGFPFRHTWPDLPLGHAVQVQSRGLQRGFIAWPYYLILGDPRLSLRAEPPYRVEGEEMAGNARVLTFSGAPEGVIPVRVPDGAASPFVEIPGVGRAWEGDPFYNAKLQMADIGGDKYLLFLHAGGDFTVRLHRTPPWYWPVLSTVTTALDHATVIHHAQGSLASGWIASGVLMLIVAWVYVRNRPFQARSLLRAVGVGLLLTALRGSYALARRAYLTTLYTHWLRTMDRAFELSPSVLVTTLLMATGGAWLYLNAGSRRGRGGALLAILFPNWLFGAFWLGSEVLINALARRRYGIPLYGYGGGIMPLIACAVEGIPIALALWGARRLAHPDRVWCYDARIEQADVPNCQQTAEAPVTDLPYGRFLKEDETVIRTILDRGRNLAPVGVYVGGHNGGPMVVAGGTRTGLGLRTRRLQIRLLPRV
jgi:hypothetical protein